MREIEFRGKASKNAYPLVAQGYASENEWLHGCLVFDGDGGPPMINVLKGAYDGDVVFVHPETVGQFTGFRDKNDTKIFEGDVIRTPEQDTGATFRSVHWVNSIASFGPFCFQLFSVAECEVVGNIHDSPALQEVTCNLV